MDLYKEAQWTFETFDKVGWYRGILQDVLIDPRLRRFGELTTNCAAACAQILGYRIATNNSLALFADVGNLEYNDDCRICLETNYTQSIEDLYVYTQSAFGGLVQRVVAFNATLQDDTPENQAKRAL